MTRLYVRAYKAEGVNDYTPDVRFERTSIMLGIRLDGTQSPFMFKGTLNGEVFTVYVKKILAPALRAGDVVIIDNLASHKVKCALEPIYQKRCYRVIFTTIQP